MQRSGFFNSKNRDRTYNAEDISMYFEGIVSDGVVLNIGEMLQVIESKEMSVKVRSGRALIESHWFKNTSDEILTVDQSELTYDRIDSVVLRMNTDEEFRSIELHMLKGTPADVPVPPTLTKTATVKELCLADIRVNKQVTKITQAEITDRRPSDRCGWVAGLIEQISTENLFAQFESAYSQFAARWTQYRQQFDTDIERWKTEILQHTEDWQEKTESDVANWQQEERNEVDKWESDISIEITEWIDTYKAFNQKRFEDWFTDVKTQLGDDVAGNLMNRINAKVEKGDLIQIIIPTTGWMNDSTGKKINIPVEQVKNYHVPIGAITKDTEESAYGCGLSGGCDVSNGIITFYADSMPQHEITYIFTIIDSIDHGLSSRGVVQYTGKTKVAVNDKGNWEIDGEDSGYIADANKVNSDMIRMVKGFEAIETIYNFDGKGNDKEVGEAGVIEIYYNFDGKGNDKEIYTNNNKGKITKTITYSTGGDKETIKYE